MFRKVVFQPSVFRCYVGLMEGNEIFSNTYLMHLYAFFFIRVCVCFRFFYILVSLWKSYEILICLLRCSISPATVGLNKVSFHHHIVHGAPACRHHTWDSNNHVPSLFPHRKCTLLRWCSCHCTWGFFSSALKTPCENLTAYRYLEDHPRTCKWLITMVSKSPP